MSPKDFSIGNEQFDLSKIQGFANKEEFAEEMKNNSFINTIFDSIDGVIDGKKDGKLDKNELAKLVDMFKFSAGGDDKLTQKEAKKFYGFQGLRNIDIKELANFMNVLTEKLTPEKLEEKLKTEFLNNNFISEEILNEFYEVDIKNETFILKKFENEKQKKEYNSKISNLILEKLQSGVLRFEIPELKEKGFNYSIEPRESKKVGNIGNITVKYSSQGFSGGGIAEIYSIENINGEMKEKLIDIYAINSKGTKSQNAANNKLLNLYSANTFGAEELIRERAKNGASESDPVQDNIKKNISEKLINIDEDSYIDIQEDIDDEGNITYTELNFQDQKEKDFNKFLRLLDQNEIENLTKHDYTERNGLKILKTADGINQLKDFKLLMETSKSFEYDDTKLDGKIENWSDFKQKGFGNCWQISSLQSLVLSEEGKKFVNEKLLNVDNDNNLTINTALRTQRYDNDSVKSIPEFLSENSDKDAIGLLRTVRSFEESDDGTLVETDYTGGNLKDFVRSVFGANAAQSIVELSSKEEIVNFLKNNKDAINSHKYITQFGFGFEFSVEEVALKIEQAEGSKGTEEANGELKGNHAYTIYSVDNDNITLIDPNYSATITVAIKDVLKNPNLTLDYGNINKLISNYNKKY